MNTASALGSTSLSWSGFTLCAGNLLYELVPRTRRAAYVAFHNVGTAAGVFVGAMAGAGLALVLPPRAVLFGDSGVVSNLLYLFLLSIPPTILGALITFAGTALYPTYARAPRVWGLSPQTDQQLAGLIMWIPGALVFFTVLTVVFFSWLNRDEYERSRDVRPATR